MHIFQVFIMYLIALLCVCLCMSCHNDSLRLIVCLSVCYHLAKIDQAGGPETFF